jgi:hypothetical protein
VTVGVGQALALHLKALFGLDRLVQALGEAPPIHQTSGELVYDDHFAVGDDVVLVAFVDHVCAQRVVQIGQHVRVLRRVDALVCAHFGQHALDALDALIRQGDDLRAFLNRVVAVGLLGLDTGGA